MRRNLNKISRENTYKTLPNSCLVGPSSTITSRPTYGQGHASCYSSSPRFARQSCRAACASLLSATRAKYPTSFKLQSFFVPWLAQKKSRKALSPSTRRQQPEPQPALLPPSSSPSLARGNRTPSASSPPLRFTKTEAALSPAPVEPVATLSLACSSIHAPTAAEPGLPASVSCSPSVTRASHCADCKNSPSCAYCSRGIQKPNFFFSSDRLIAAVRLIQGICSNYADDPYSDAPNSYTVQQIQQRS